MRYSVTVKPNSKKGPLVEQNTDGSLTVYLRQRVVDGQANEALVKVLAEYFGVAKTRVTIVRGHKSRHKAVEIS